ncbi:MULTISPECIES: hypothetical protein [Rhodopseudomonas]|uniref:Uncharacterized protein n=1 Tax=Rhodopseudomonas palustris TaxID=1076 RepID=A0A0D7F480_RHOPL|nr:MULTISPECIES: hypothetical protein [Rhodopseudomonas]KIZ47894.1 hypothetical protein OO17_01810 [Rhodopseudomonas palustris]MDF3810721.1 hypothetical protein [Rhodopseudomonas sp. BAL398]WOK20527.1 hypothetical protein RBJ75_13845 [Rhodopseudomonas sp. BAL398]
MFTQDEQKQAQSIMSQQLSDAMGLANPFNHSDPAKEYLAGVRFLDAASPEEKASDNWRVNRAIAQTGYESAFAQARAGQKPANVDSGDPVVNMQVQAIHNAEGTWSSTTDGSYVTDISKITLFSDGKYDSALQQARSQNAQTSKSRVDVSV